jgi:hypothetical protein
MAKTAIWGQTYKVLLDTGLTENGFVLDSSELNGPDVLDGSVRFNDVTEYVLSLNIKRGRQTQLDSMSIGQATIVLDDKASERAFDPANTASPYFLGTSGIAPRRFVANLRWHRSPRTVVHRPYQRPRHRLRPTRQLVRPSHLHRRPLHPRTHQPPRLHPIIRTVISTSQAILDRPEVAYSTATRSIATGVATLGTVAYDDNQNVKSAIDAVVLAEDGRFFINRGGTAVFQPRISFTFSTATIQFSDTAGTAYAYQALSVGYGAETLYNRVQVGVQGFSVATAIDDTSSTEFGVTHPQPL